MQPWIYAVLSVAFVSAASLIGVLALSARHVKGALLYFVSFSAGAFFGDVFLHLLPEATEGGFTLQVSIALLAGIVFSFVVEKFIHWHHCHHLDHEHHVRPFAVMNLVGDAVHNLIDGIIIGASYLISIPVGIATTVAVLFHEIPQEIGDFGVLVHGGFSRAKALLFNVLTALTSLAGVGLAFLLSARAEGFALALIPFAAGNFIYIAAADLIPEIHKETRAGQSALHLLTFLVGIGVMAALLLLE